MFDSLTHVYPVNDIEEHITDVDDVICKCKPVEINGIIIHNAFDGRDIIEEIERGEYE